MAILQCLAAAAAFVLASAQTMQGWRLLAKQDAGKCAFSANASTTFQQNPMNSSADCFMAMSQQDFGTVWQPGGFFTLRLLWTLWDGTTKDIIWKQASLPALSQIINSSAVSPDAASAMSYAFPMLGARCTAFAGLGTSDDPSSCVFDGNSLGSCKFSCIGAIKLVNDSSLTGQFGIAGPFMTLMKNYSLYVMEAPTTTSTTTTSLTTTTTLVPQGYVVTVDFNFTLAVDDPWAFVGDPNVPYVIAQTLANQVGVSSDDITVALSVVFQRRLDTRRLGIFGTAVSVGTRTALTAAVSSSASRSGGSSGSSPTPAPAVSPASLAASLSQTDPTTLGTGISVNLQQVTVGRDAPTVVVTSQSAPKVSVVNAAVLLTTVNPATTASSASVSGSVAAAPKKANAGARLQFGIASLALVGFSLLLD